MTSRPIDGTAVDTSDDEQTATTAASDSDAMATKDDDFSEETVVRSIDTNDDESGTDDESEVRFEPAVAGVAALVPCSVAALLAPLALGS